MTSPAAIAFPGRCLLLVDDAALVSAQLAGLSLAWSAELPLRDDISTDEITPAWVCYHHDETLGDFPYVGLRCGEDFPVQRHAVKRGGFVASVSGKRRGKGSSREASPYAERAAGIRLVVARSFERIYRENCQNLGLFTTTDFAVLNHLLNGSPVPLAFFTDGEGPITRGIIEAGGLFPYNTARLAGTVHPPRPRTTHKPMTLAEKVLARHWVVGTGEPDGVDAVKPGDEGFVRCDLRFSHEYVTPMAAELFAAALGPDAQVADPASVLLFRDHLTHLEAAMSDARKAEGLLDLALTLKSAQEAFAERHGVRLYGELPTGRGSEAICHSKILEAHALPGQIVVGTDSHTSHAGAIGCLAFGVGTTAMANAWLTRDVRLVVPSTVRVRVRGLLPPGCTAKDLMLELLRTPFVRDGRAIGKVLEYTGSAVMALSVDERATLTNMAAEVGAFTAIVPPDDETVRFLTHERGMPESVAREHVRGLAGDADAAYEETIELDAESIAPLVALPGDPGNGVRIDELGRLIRIDIAYAGSCTAGKKADLDMYAAVFAEAAARGQRIPPQVQCYIQVGSQEVRRHAERAGYLALFEAVGAVLLEPGCGACINAGPGVSHSRETVTVSAINRNFPGRSGPGQVYLASPYTVAASALAGWITSWDPYPARTDAD